MKKVTLFFFVTMSLSLFFIFPKQIYGKTELSIDVNFDQDFYSTTDTVSAKLSVDKKSGESIKRTRIRLKIYDRLQPGSSMTKFRTKGKRSIFRRTWYEEIGDKTVRFDFSKDLSNVTIGEGVYPVEVIVDLKKGKEQKESSFLIIMNERQDPLAVSLIWDWHFPPQLGPSGTFASSNLQKKIGSDKDRGIFFDYLKQINENQAVKLNLAFSPALLSEIKATSAGYKVGGKKVKVVDGESSRSRAANKLIIGFQELLKDGDRIEMLSTPYGYTSLPNLIASGWQEDFDVQLEKGRSTIQSIFPLSNLSQFFYPPRLALDRASADSLLRSGIKKVIVGENYFDEDKKKRINMAVPITSVGDETLTGFKEDPELNLILSESKEDEIRNKLHAFIAMRLLSESTKDSSIIGVINGQNELIDNETIGEIFNFFSDNPWVNTEKLSSLSSTQTTKKAELVEAVDEIIETDDLFLDDLDKTRQEVLDFSSAVSKNNQLKLDLNESLLAAEYIGWINDEPGSKKGEGEEYLRSINRLIAENYNNIEIGSAQTITFSGNRGKIPISITNNNDYPVYLTLKLEGGKDFLISDDKKDRVKIMPKENLLVYKVQTNFKGISSLDIGLFSGSREITSSSVRISVSNMAKNILNVISAVSLLIVAVLILRGRIRGRSV